MKKSVALPCVVILLASIVAGCGSSGNVATSSTAPTPVPLPSTPCTAPPGYMIQEVFPQNGATNQPNLEGVVFDVGPNPQSGGVTPSPLPTSWFFYVSYSGSGASPIPSYPTNLGFLATPVPVPGSTAGATPTPLPVPSDAPSPGFSAYIQETASNGILANSALGSSSFTVFLANSSCYPGIQQSTFTTSSFDNPSPSPSPTGT